MDTDLPLEIQLLIVRDITHHDFTQVALVNKSWSRAANTFVWKTIRLLSISQANIYLNGRDTHRRHLHHVETFQTRLLAAATRTLIDGNGSCLTPRLLSLDIMLPTHRAHMSAELDRSRHLREMVELIEERLKAHGSIPEDENDIYFDDDVFADKATMMHDQEQPLLELLRRNPQR